MQDIRYALRVLRRSPVFLGITVLTLALGIGANVAIFTLVDAVLLRPLPFREPDRLVRIIDDLDGAAAKDVGMSAPELFDLQSAPLFESVSTIVPTSSALSGGDRAERIELLGVSPNYFEVLGATAALGHVFRQADWAPGFLDGAVISDSIWKRLFGGDPHVIGRRIRVDEDGYTVVAVMPPGFRHPGKTLNGEVEMWLAAGFLADPFPSPPVRATRFLSGAIGRLRRGMTLQQAQERLNALTAQWQRDYPKEYPKQLRWSLRIEPVQEAWTANVRPMLMVVLAAVGFVLLMVCVNIASLLLARSAGRMREFAIRQALGASRGRLVRLMLIESLVVSVAGGMAAIAVLRLAGTSLLALMPAGVPRLTEIQFDWRTLFLALLLSLITGVLFGLTPALYASAINPNRDLKEGGRTGGGQSVRQNRWRAVLVTIEVALSVVLLTGAGLLIRSFSAMLRQQPGLEPKGLTTAQIWIPIPNNPKLNRYLTRGQRASLAREVLRQAAVLPGVEKAAIGLSTDVPFLENVRSQRSFSFPGETFSQQDVVAEYGAVSPEYFDVLKIPLKKGRVFSEHDSETAKKVAIVNETFVRKYSPQTDVIGRRLLDGGTGLEYEIAGVVGDVLDQGLDVPTTPRVYASIFQNSRTSLAVFLRTRADSGAIKEPLARMIHGIDAELPVFGIRTIEELMSASMARRRFSLFLMSAFAAVALLLAALGVYGVMAFVVSTRVQEFGIRSALGAQPRHILLLAFRPGLVLTGVGIIAGLAASMAVMRLMSSLLFGVSAGDPLIFTAVPLVMVIVTASACYVPAKRATRISPVEALRF